MIGQIKTLLKKCYLLYIKRPKAYIEFSWPLWRFFNRKSRKLFEKKPPQLNEIQKKIVEGMNKDGIYITHFDELFPDQPELLAEMLTLVPSLMAGAKQDPKKKHFKNFWDTRSFYLDPKNVFVRFVLSPRVVDIANSYAQMWTRFHLCNGYLSEPELSTQKRIATQNWHRDAHDKQLSSVFIYLTDVTKDEDGSFWFVKGTHQKGSLSQVFPQPRPYSTFRFSSCADAMESAFPEESKMMCLGRAGTIIFADATGIHRGGHTLTNKRVMVLADYVSDHKFSKTNRLSYPQDLSSLRALPEQVVYAIHLEDGRTPQAQQKKDVEDVGY